MIQQGVGDIGEARLAPPQPLMAECRPHLVPPRLMSSTFSLTVMEGDVLLKSMVGSIRRRSRGCRLYSRSRSRLRAKYDLLLPEASNLST